MKTFIIIPYFNKFKLVNDRLLDLARFCGKETNIVLVNDHSQSSDNGEPLISYWQKNSFPTLKYYKSEENKGFGASMNTGVKIAEKNGADAVILLSNDVIVQSNIVKEQEELIEKDSYCLIGGSLYFHNTGWNVLDDCGVVPYCEGYFLSCSINTWNLLGGFDRQYGLFDFEDLDLSTMAWWLGIHLATTTSKLRHIGGATINSTYPERVKYTKINQKLWQEKWANKAKELKRKIYYDAS